MISPAKALVVILILLGLLSPAAAEVLRLDYEGFAVWLDCERRSAVKFRYNAQRDQGNLERPSTDQRAHPCKHLRFRLTG